MAGAEVNIAGTVTAVGRLAGHGFCYRNRGGSWYGGVIEDRKSRSRSSLKVADVTWVESDCAGSRLRPSGPLQMARVDEPCCAGPPLFSRQAPCFNREAREVPPKHAALECGAHHIQQNHDVLVHSKLIAQRQHKLRSASYYWSKDVGFTAQPNRFSLPISKGGAGRYTLAHNCWLHTYALHLWSH